MKLIVDIKDSNLVPFMEFVQSNDLVKDVKQVKRSRKSGLVKGLTQSFREIKLYEQGKKKLKNAKDFLGAMI